MDNLQYIAPSRLVRKEAGMSFKPYYKWITFNIYNADLRFDADPKRFKPYYKWITFNILNSKKNTDFMVV